ncbi:hypothetical protein BCV70DRAFT_14987 [Testicularia cyperi]|uniref:Uncharacterized protein n=1 Tax=Testicularia cyperi TaxID=1882483 RepID=A0A317Y111_9BASI|nr:hypothetical protein BCV70DRAFT_14987 [Testicularia cyperi]
MRRRSTLVDLTRSKLKEIEKDGKLVCRNPTSNQSSRRTDYILSPGSSRWVVGRQSSFFLSFCYPPARVQCTRGRTSTSTSTRAGGCSKPCTEHDRVNVITNRQTDGRTDGRKTFSERCSERQRISAPTSKQVGRGSEVGKRAGSHSLMKSLHCIPHPLLSTHPHSHSHSHSRQVHIAQLHKKPAKYTARIYAIRHRPSGNPAPPPPPH